MLHVRCKPKVIHANTNISMPTAIVGMAHSHSHGLGIAIWAKSPAIDFSGGRWWAGGVGVLGPKGLDIVKAIARLVIRVNIKV